MIEGPYGSRYTLGWCLRHHEGHCYFLVEGSCSIYTHRPWICRTYPFMLDGGDLVVSECEGLGQAISLEKADDLARTLLQRQHAEGEEERRVQNVMHEEQIPHGEFVVIDSEGMRIVGR
jgi:Fe-S-cluster containining protein